MSRLLNALLDISKLESGAIKPEITDFKVAALFEELRREFASLAINKGLKLEIDGCEDRVHSDPALVGQVIRNLVSNAIEYTREGCVRLRCLHDMAFVRLEVLDTGVGIASTELARIYEDFYQVGVSTNTSRDGYGLGLSIVSRIVNLLGVKLDVQSEMGRGTTFSLELPAGEGVAAAPIQRSPDPRISADRATRCQRVLLVEDDPRVRNATRMWLKTEGYEVLSAGGLSEALQHLSNVRDIGLLVTDYHLADGETATEVIAAVRSLLGPDLPAILITGDTSSAMREPSCDAHLRTASKPINPDELLRLFGELLAGQLRGPPWSSRRAL
jgi:two-component system, sensor histidine kinase